MRERDSSENIVALIAALHKYININNVGMLNVVYAYIIYIHTCIYTARDKIIEHIINKFVYLRKLGRKRF